MKIIDYISEIHHAVETVTAELHQEYEVLGKIRSELSALTTETNDGYSRAEFFALNPDLDDEGLATATYWDTYFGVDKDRHYKKAEYNQAVQRVEARQFSVSALSGSLLQYGRQGISLHYGKNGSGCPDGRNVVGDIHVKEIIWQARNQAIHWEEGSFREPTTKLFEALATINPVFAEFKTRSLASEIIGLLGWHNAEAFFADMLLLNE